MTGTAVLVVDRLGRRPLLLGGVSGMVNKGCPVSVFLLFIIFFSYSKAAPARMQKKT
jgi:hypothetical protein